MNYGDDVNALADLGWGPDYIGLTPVSGML